MQFEDQLGDDQIEQAVTEKLEPLVVRAACTAMGERLPEQTFVGEGMPQGLLGLNSRPRD
jgi:hypothetical protein